MGRRRNEEESKEENVYLILQHADIGMKLSSDIYSAEQPLERLLEVTQNLPALASDVSKTQISKEFKDAYQQTKRTLSNFLPEGHSRVWLNGILLNIWDIDETNVYKSVPCLFYCQNIS